LLLANVDTHVVKTLLASGMSVNVADLNSEMALIAAINNGYFLSHNNLEVVQILIEHGANISTQTAAGNTAFDVANILRSANFVNFLCKHYKKKLLDDENDVALHALFQMAVYGNLL
jgi:ankyrin repeat protein